MCVFICEFLIFSYVTIKNRHKDTNKNPNLQEKLTLLSHFLSKILNLRRNLTFLPTFLRIIRYFSPRRYRKPPCDRRFSVYGCRDYFSFSFSRFRRLDSFTILSMRSCILCPGCGHGSSNTVTFIISNVYLFFHCFNYVMPIRPIVSGRRVVNA